ncbi:sensor histidine kinase [Mesorhizobium loti]|nr:ATP-binding protein [Mesorhizobium loti]PLP61068.1 sensor histidine kinase [Mesorhizobium loti]
MKAIAKQIVPQSLRAQIIAVIVLAAVVINVLGEAIETFTEGDHPAMPNMEAVAERAGMLARLLDETPTDARDAVLAATNRAGFDFRLLPRQTIDQIPSSPRWHSDIGRLFGTLFPPDYQLPYGGRWLTVEGRPGLAFNLDDTTALVQLGVPDTFLTTQFVSPASYYLLALIVLFCLFSLFAVWAITDPLKRIVSALGKAELDSGEDLFAERGSNEIIGLARALNKMRARIRTMIDNRTRMLRSVSHDLRTPLTRLRLRAERLDEGKQRSAMLSDIAQIEGLIDETLTYLRNDVSTEVLQQADIASVLQTVCAEFTDIGFSVSYCGPDRLPGWCKPNALARAIGNLCDNSVKFAPHVTVALASTEATALIEVRDDGPGIPEMARGRVFEPFFKMDSARGSASKHGFGLGLSIVADIVHGHGGRIELIDNEPTGLIVRVDLPCMPVAA